MFVITVLEQREKEAAARWREAQVISQKEKVADRIRKEWEANAEAVAYAAHKEQIKQKEDLQKRKEPTTFVVSVGYWKWLPWIPRVTFFKINLFISVEVEP